MAITLAQAKQHARTPQELFLVTELAASPLMSVFPFRTFVVDGLFYKR